MAATVCDNHSRLKEGFWLVNGILGREETANMENDTREIGIH